MGYLDRLRGMFDAPGSGAGAEGSSERSPLERELVASLQARLDQPGSLLRLALRFTGQVQGVGFRWTNRSIAQELGCTGWVRNEPDGSVTMEIQGLPGQLIRHLDTLHDRYRRMRCRIWLSEMDRQRPHADEGPFTVIGY